MPSAAFRGGQPIFFCQKMPSAAFRGGPSALRDLAEGIRREKKSLPLVRLFFSLQETLHGFFWRVGHFFGQKNALHAFFWRAFGPPRFFLEGRQPSTLFFGGSPALHDFFLAGRQAKMAFFSAFLLYNSHFRCNMMFSHGLFFSYCIFLFRASPRRFSWRAFGPPRFFWRVADPPKIFGGSATLHDFFWRVCDPPRFFLEGLRPSTIFFGGSPTLHALWRVFWRKKKAYTQSSETRGELQAVHEKRLREA